MTITNLPQFDGVRDQVVLPGEAGGMAPVRPSTCCSTSGRTPWRFRPTNGP